MANDSEGKRYKIASAVKSTKGEWWDVEFEMLGGRTKVIQIKEPKMFIYFGKYDFQVIGKMLS